MDKLIVKGNRIASYFDMTGETIEGEIIEVSFDKPMTLLRAEFEAKKLLRELGGGHLDIWYAETGEFAIDIEI